MSKSESAQYALAEQLNHLLTKVEELMLTHKELSAIVEEIEDVKKHIAEELIK